MLRDARKSAVYHFDTGEIEPLGNVRVKLITQ
jgi:hypothetical protein